MSKELMQILLAEDDEGHANLILRNLNRAGIENPIVRVKDGQEALDFIHRQGSFANRTDNRSLVLLLDLNMPRVDGYEVLRQLKGKETTASIPVIVLTTTDDPREIERCYSLGCGIYVTKPVQYESFAEAINRLGLMLQIVRVPKQGNSREDLLSK